MGKEKTILKTAKGVVIMVRHWNAMHVKMDLLYWMMKMINVIHLVL